MTNLVAVGKGIYQSGENELLVTDGKYKAARGVVIAPPGHGAGALNAAPPGAGFELIRGVVEEGYAWYSIDAGGTATWSGPAAITAVGNAVTRALSLFGGSKVAGFGYSMALGLLLNWAKRNSTKIAGIYGLDGVTDLNFVHQTSGYTPAYSTSGVSTPPGSWATEAEAAFSTNAAGWTAATAGYRIYDDVASYRSLCPILLGHATDDSTLAYAGSTSWVTNVNDANVKMRSGAALTGNHTGVIANLPPAEVVAFLDSLSW